MTQCTKCGGPNPDDGSTHYCNGDWIVGPRPMGITPPSSPLALSAAQVAVLASSNSDFVAFPPLASLVSLHSSCRHPLVHCQSPMDRFLLLVGHVTQ